MKGMTLIVKKTTQLIAGMIFMYGIYVIVHGHLTPGGGFAGGVIIAGSFILITLAYGGDFLKLLKEETGTTIVESLATIMVILIALSGFLFGTRIFFNNFLPEGHCRTSCKCRCFTPLQYFCRDRGRGINIYNISFTNYL